jgi:hypothetical protein
MTNRPTYPVISRNVIAKKCFLLLFVLTSSITSFSQSRNSNQILKISSNRENTLINVTIFNDSTAFIGKFQLFQNCLDNELHFDTSIYVGLNTGINNFKLEINNINCQNLNISVVSIYDSLYFDLTDLINKEEVSLPTVIVQFNQIKLLNPSPLDTYNIKINSIQYFNGAINYDSLILTEKDMRKDIDSVIEISVNETLFKTIYFNKNTFSLIQNRKNELPDTLKKRKISLHGSTSINQTFGEKNQPYLQNNALPFTQIKSSNKLVLFDIPIRINFQYNSSNSIDKNFRSYFNISLDKTEFQKSLNDFQTRIIETKKQTLNEQISNLEDQKKQLLVNRIDTDLNNTRINNDSNIFKVDSTLQIADSLQIANSINEIQTKIDLLNKSIKSLEQSESLKNNHNSINSLQTLKKLDNFEIGNFYETITTHSLNNVEIKGINLKLAINSNQSIHILSGRKNKITFEEFPQSIFSSIGYLNSRFNKINFSSYVSLDQVKQNKTTNDIILSQIIDGQLSRKLEYTIESNLLINEGPIDYFNQSASLMEIKYFILKNFSLSAGIETIGKNYNSDGAFLLQNDLFSRYLKSNLSLFKNKINISAAYNNLERYKSQESIENKKMIYSFELISRFQKLPNFYYSLKPINFDLFTQLDTNLFKVSMNSLVEITRITYSKRVKNTYYKILLSRTNIVTKSNSTETERVEDQQSNHQLIAVVSYNKNNYSISLNSFDNLNSLSSINLDVSNSFNDKFNATIGFVALLEKKNQYGFRLMSSYQINKTIESNIGINSYDKYFSINFGLKMTY